jgi:serine/threonine protein kinase
MLVDFGIAKLFDAGLKTTMGARAVTPCYSPLEQYGRGVTDARSDVYALGATLYTVLTGQEPPESVARATGAACPSPHALNPAVSLAVDAAITRAMQMKPEDRFASISEFKAVLQRSAAFLSKQAASAARRRPSAPVIVAPANAARGTQVSPAIAAPPPDAAASSMETAAPGAAASTPVPARRKASPTLVITLIVIAVLVNICLCLWFLGIISSS